MGKKSDLIDRNELYNQIRLYLNRHSLGETAVWTTLTIGEIANIIANIPTVEVEPVQHGEWNDVQLKLFIDEPTNGFECSQCKTGWFNVTGFNYCPNCGAKMDGE